MEVTKMTPQQQNELLEIMIENSDIYDDIYIVTSIMFCHYRKNFFKILRQIITIFRGINPCTNDLLKAIIGNGSIEIGGMFFSFTRPSDKHYEELKKLMEEHKKNDNTTK